MRRRFPAVRWIAENGSWNGLADSSNTFPARQMVNYAARNLYGIAMKDLNVFTLLPMDKNLLLFLQHVNRVGSCKTYAS